MKKVVIVGAGILGATTAYRLAKTGVEVTIVDRDDRGQATKAAAGIICPWLAQRRNKAWYHLAKNGAAMYPNLIAELTEDVEADTGYKRVGALSLHTDEEKLRATEQRVLKRKQSAPEIGEMALLNEADTQKMFPLLAPSYQSLHISGAARVDGQALLRALLEGAVTYGATLIHGEAHITEQHNRATGVNVGNDHIAADLVIATTGAWMNELFQPLGINYDIAPQKAQIIHLQLPNTPTSTWPVVMPPNNQYLLTFPNNRIVIGATHESNAGFDDRVTAQGVNEVLSKAIDVAPGLANSTILETKVGFRPFSPGSLPVIGKLPGFEGILLANGLGATGLTMGPYVGEELAKLALGRELSINLADYDVASAYTSTRR